ncbi:hypothetical protein [Methylomonas koyamae]|uniref:hypothetical protein n=1 Tax=Methylomonas koyamae TaxID=702114 RepID=UPI003570C1C0
MSPQRIQKRYGVHRDIVGGGWLGLEPGQVTDDTRCVWPWVRQSSATKLEFVGGSRKFSGLAGKRAGRCRQYLPPRHPPVSRPWRTVRRSTRRRSR